MTPRYSVIVCNYNNGRYLRDCLGSVLAQSLYEGELIVADDGSTDESLEILADAEPAVSVIRLPHGSSTKRRNQTRAFQAAFQASKGEFVFLLDSDDAFLPGKIDAYLQAFASDPTVVMVQAPMLLINGKGIEFGLEHDSRRHWRDPLSEMYRRNEVNMHYATSALAFRRSYLEQRYPWEDERRGVATDTALAVVAPHFGRIVTLEQPYTLWRRHENSRTIATPFQYFRETEMKRDYFNDFCRQRSLPRLRKWTSARYLAYWSRNRLLPTDPPHWFRRLRWFLLPRAEKENMRKRADSRTPFSGG